MAEILIENVSKSYVSKDGSVQALKNVNLAIESGDIFGIIGMSGAGKSTLVRCMNFLEVPTEGTVSIRGKALSDLSEKELRKEREKIGMIFQHFNLMPSRTVFGNVAYPLRGSGLSREQIADKVHRLLELVGIGDKAEAYPKQLSGGQKQRVAIARALANDPNVLLCDEATSALDPQTTKAILRLLKNLNEKLGITVVIITHEMAVVKEICDRVAVMEDGHIVEEGSIVEVFTHPQAKVTKNFIASTSTTDRIYDLIEEGHALTELGEDEVIVSLKYDANNASQSLISEISRTYDVDCNIIFGNIEVVKDTPIGTLIVVLKGDPEKRKAAFDCIKRHGVETEVIKR